MPILEKVCISLYLGIFRLTAAATATSQELSISGKAPGPSRTGSKYPVQESLTSISLKSVLGIVIVSMHCASSFITNHMTIPVSWARMIHQSSRVYLMDRTDPISK